ncbi:hypothetical protein PR048_021882 [Dryococelus australis]|uniref:Uncharacterized protein n=1 Tax=Dryococelus australis TaxID=614101 RepID=A0ABQ9GZF8_9NEOP|nr:hypothetical protein PR048_021882 [Dryococelus australis]
MVPTPSVPRSISLMHAQVFDFFPVGRVWQELYRDPQNSPVYTAFEIRWVSPNVRLDSSIGNPPLEVRACIVQTMNIGISCSRLTCPGIRTQSLPHPRSVAHQPTAPRKVGSRLKVQYRRAYSFTLHSSRCLVLNDCSVMKTSNTFSTWRPVAAPAYLQLLSAFEAEERGSDRGDNATRIKCAIAVKREGLNWSAVFSSHCVYLWDFHRAVSWPPDHRGPRGKDAETPRPAAAAVTNLGRAGGETKEATGCLIDLDELAGPDWSRGACSGSRFTQSEYASHCSLLALTHLHNELTSFVRGASVAERLARPPSTKANWAQSPTGSPDFRKWESCRTLPLVGGSSRGAPVSLAPSFRRRTIFTSITLNGSQNLARQERKMWNERDKRERKGRKRENERERKGGSEKENLKSKLDGMRVREKDRCGGGNGEVLVALNTEVFRADEYEVSRNATAGKRNKPEKTHRPTASSGTIHTCKNPDGEWTVYVNKRELVVLTVAVLFVAGEQPEAVTSDSSLRNVNKGPVPAPRSGASSRVWTWLTLRSQTSTAPCQIGPSNPGTPVQNHYTVDEAYAAVGEALYAELDRESAHSPAYQNTGYNGSDLEPDLAVSSAPSSAYYSDLSCPDRTYEAIGMVHVASAGWEGGDAVQRRTQPTRLAAITETTSVPSDYPVCLPPRQTGFNPRWVTGFSYVGIVPDDVAGRRTFSGISRFPSPFIPALLHTHLNYPYGPFLKKCINSMWHGLHKWTEDLCRDVKPRCLNSCSKFPGISRCRILDANGSLHHVP